jgi:DNA polymerase III epsilon subunit-like protein
MVIVFLFYLKWRQDFRGTENIWNFESEPSVTEDPGPSFSEAFIREQAAASGARLVSKQEVARRSRPAPDFQRFLVVDFETTGVKWPYHAVEVAWIELDRNFQEIDSRSSLIKPPVRIPAEVTAIHGITNEDVADAPSLDEFFLDECGNPFESEHVCFIAHNAPFDYRLFKPFSQTSTLICTLAASRKLYPEAKNHKLEFLAKSHGFDDHTAHRAMGDARTCLALLRHLQHHFTLDFSELLESGNPYPLLRALPFGKHKGVPIENVPEDYLEWLYMRMEEDDPVFPTVKFELERREDRRRRRRR